MASSRPDPPEEGLTVLRREPMRIRIIGTEEECLIASDRLARLFNVRSVPRPTYTGDGPGKDYRVQFDARLRERDQDEDEDDRRRRRRP